MVSATLLGTIAVHLTTMVYLWLSAQPIDPVEILNLITIPSMLLNLILVLPINALIGEVNKFLSPELDPA